jgi:hypothetical protein
MLLMVATPRHGGCDATFYCALETIIHVHQIKQCMTHNTKASTRQGEKLQVKTLLGKKLQKTLTR